LFELPQTPACRADIARFGNYNVSFLVSTVAPVAELAVVVLERPFLECVAEGWKLDKTPAHYALLLSSFV
jgi:5-hydroxyisourate hydrolase-like protein (transthyretin family)